jgi:hypothetical protein
LVEDAGIAYEPHFTAFIDLLGFAEASTGGDEFTRAKVLAFLMSISSIRSEFNFQSSPAENGTAIQINPTISTFSDHIVISYPLRRIAASLGSDDSQAALHVLSPLERCPSDFLFGVARPLVISIILAGLFSERQWLRRIS